MKTKAIIIESKVRSNIESKVRSNIESKVRSKVGSKVGSKVRSKLNWSNMQANKVLHFDNQRVNMASVVQKYHRLRYLYARNCVVDWDGFDHCCELEQETYCCFFPTFIADLTIEIDWQPIDLNMFSKVIYCNNNTDQSNQVIGLKYNGPILVVHCTQRQYEANYYGSTPWWL